MDISLAVISGSARSAAHRIIKSGRLNFVTTGSLFCPRQDIMYIYMYAARRMMVAPRGCHQEEAGAIVPGRQLHHFPDKRHDAVFTRAIRELVYTSDSLCGRRPRGGDVKRNWSLDVTFLPSYFSSYRSMQSE